MASSNWEILETTDVLHSPWLRIQREHVRLPDGTTIQDFYTINSPDQVAILALDADNHVYLVEQYRHAVRDVTLDLPGGMIDSGESPEQAARRELFEETGIQPDALVLLNTYYPDSGRTTSRKYIFLAGNVQPPHHRPQLAPGEHLRVIRLMLPEIERRIANGEMPEATIQIAISAYRRYLNK